jgi:uncharacterized repeat protein (TIGR04138 family)
VHNFLPRDFLTIPQNVFFDSARAAFSRFCAIFPGDRLIGPALAACKSRKPATRRDRTTLNPFMQKVGFAEAVDSIVEMDVRYDREAYAFVRDALDFTLKQRKKTNREDPQRHVSGQELLDGVRQFAIKEFGPMVTTVFSYWGIHKCEDFGCIVFNLITAGIFGKNDHDTIEDFKGGFVFWEAFVEPFLPPKAPVRPQEKKSNDQPAEKLQ